MHPFRAASSSSTLSTPFCSSLCRFHMLTQRQCLPSKENNVAIINVPGVLGIPKKRMNETYCQQLAVRCVEQISGTVAVKGEDSPSSARCIGRSGCQEYKRRHIECDKRSRHACGVKRVGDSAPPDRGWHSASSITLYSLYQVLRLSTKFPR